MIAFTGCGASQREKTLRATLIATNAARAGFTKFDADHQQQIVKDATSLEDGKAKLAAYREDRDKVRLLFEAVYEGIAAAMLLDDKAPLTELLKAAENLEAALTKLKGSP
jgi:hypothetical protein